MKTKSHLTKDGFCYRPNCPEHKLDMKKLTNLEAYDKGYQAGRKNLLNQVEKEIPKEKDLDTIAGVDCYRRAEGFNLAVDLIRQKLFDFARERLDPLPTPTSKELLAKNIK